MASYTGFQAIRMYSGPLDTSLVFSTKASMDSYKSNGASYGGMIVGCREDNSAYILNSGKTAWIKINGSAGSAGKDGLTPEIGTNGNWYVGDTDTGVKAQGPEGELAGITINSEAVEAVEGIVNIDLATVAETGDYDDLTNKPALKPVATSGLYTDLTARPTLATVATTGDYDDLSSKPTYATVATTGDYDDLTGKPSLSAVALSGNYDDLGGKPTIPDDVSDLTDTTNVIPTDVNELNDEDGLLVGVTDLGTFSSWSTFYAGLFDSENADGIYQARIDATPIQDDVKVLITLDTSPDTTQRYATFTTSNNAYTVDWALVYTVSTEATTQKVQRLYYHANVDEETFLFNVSALKGSGLTYVPIIDGVVDSKPVTAIVNDTVDGMYVRLIYGNSSKIVLYDRTESEIISTQELDANTNAEDLTEATTLGDTDVFAFRRVSGEEYVSRKITVDNFKATDEYFGITKLSDATSGAGLGTSNDVVTETVLKAVYDELDSTCDYLLGLLEE